MAWWPVERWEALRLALGARGCLAARGGYVNPASRVPVGALAPPAAPSPRAVREGLANLGRNSRRENERAWLFEIRTIYFVSRARCGILHAASQNRDPGWS